MDSRRWKELGSVLKKCQHILVTNGLSTSWCQPYWWRGLGLLLTARALERILLFTERVFSPHFRSHSHCICLCVFPVPGNSSLFNQETFFHFVFVLFICLRTHSHMSFISSKLRRGSHFSFFFKFHKWFWWLFHSPAGDSHLHTQ